MFKLICLVTMFSLSVLADNPPISIQRSKTLDGFGIPITSTSGGTGHTAIDVYVQNPGGGTTVVNQGGQGVSSSPWFTLDLQVDSDLLGFKSANHADLLSIKTGGIAVSNLPPNAAQESGGHLASIDTKLTAPITVGGVSVTALPLPPNAAQESGGHLASIDTKLTAPLTVGGIAVTSLPLPPNAAQETGGNLAAIKSQLAGGLATTSNSLAPNASTATNQATEISSLATIMTNTSLSSTAANQTNGNQKTQVTSVTPTSDYVSSGTLINGSSVVTLSTNGIGEVGVNITGGPFVGNIQVQGVPPGTGNITNLSTLQSGLWTTSPITATGFYKAKSIAGYSGVEVVFTSYTSGSATINLEGTPAVGTPNVAQSNAANLNATVVQATGTNLHTVVDNTVPTTVAGVATSNNQLNGLQKTLINDDQGITWDMFPNGEGRIQAEAHQLFLDSYDTGLDTTTKWNTPVAAGGGQSATTNTPGDTLLGTGTTANGYSYLTSRPTFRGTAPGWLRHMNAVNIEFPVLTNAYRFWGIGTVPVTPTAAAPLTDACGYEIATSAKMFAVCYSGGTRNVIQDLSTSTGNSTQPQDSAVHKYFLYFRGDYSFWAIDDAENVVATMPTGAPGPIVNVLPITMVAVAGTSGPSSTGTLQSNVVFMGDTSGARGNNIADATNPWQAASVSALGGLGSNIVQVGGTSVTAGQSPMANSIPVVIASNQSSISTLTMDGAGSGISSQTSTINTNQRYLNSAVIGDDPAATVTAAAALNADAFPAQDISQYVGATVQITGAFTATGTFQGSNDNFTTTSVVNCYSTIVSTSASVTTFAAAGTFYCPRVYKQFRVRLTAYTSGTATGTVQLFSTMPTDPFLRQIIVASGTVTTVSTVTTLANGQTAHSAASTGSPVRVAGRAITTLDTTLVQGDATDLAVTTGQQLMIKPFATSENDWQATSGTTPLATTTSTQLKAAGAASIRNFVTACQFYNTSATVSTTVSLLDGASNIWTGYLPATTAALPVVPIQVDFPTPLRGTAATAMNVQLGTTSASVYYNCEGYQSF